MNGFLPDVILQMLPAGCMYCILGILLSSMSMHCVVMGHLLCPNSILIEYSMKYILIV